jgi:hypothetical protein
LGGGRLHPLPSFVRSTATMGQLVRAVAAGRKARALFKTLSRVEVAFNPFDPSATTARFVSADQNFNLRKAPSGERLLEV